MDFRAEATLRAAKPEKQKSMNGFYLRISSQSYKQWKENFADIKRAAIRRPSRKTMTTEE